MMKFSNIAVFAIMLLPLSVYGEKISEDNNQAAKSSQSNQPTKEVTLAELQKEAESGDAVAQSNLGSIYSAGIGIPKDTIKAMEWFQKAANQGNAIAQRNLGLIYENGDGLPKDNVKASEWYQKAAVRGDSIGQFRLGLMYVRNEHEIT